jgi:hypothetical protein
MVFSKNGQANKFILERFGMTKLCVPCYCTDSEVASAIMMAVRRWQFVNYALGNPLNQERAEGGPAASVSGQVEGTYSRV